MNIEQNINQFLEGNGKNKGRKPNERYASFDFCYNYFYSFYKNNKLHELANDKNIQTSCLHLGFYLASWGMMRGSSFLLEKSISNYKNLIILISQMNPKLWEIDVDIYNEENISFLKDCKKKIIKALGEENSPSDTLITKIMLGVFGNVPAYDQYFKIFLRNNNISQTFNTRSLMQIKEFYQKHEDIFKSYKIKTFDFLTATAKETDIFYTKAKLIDMVGFINGFNKRVYYN